MCVGLVIYPIQQGFLKPLSETKGAGWDISSAERYYISIAHISDIPGTAIYTNRDTVKLRKQLAIWEEKSCEPRLWMSGPRENVTNWQQRCAREGEEGWGFENLDKLSDPFIAQLPYGFSTGFKQEYAPRINTSVSYESIAVEDAPEGCFSLEDDSRFVKYHYEYVHPFRSYQSWNLSTCIPSSALITPIKETRDRQDFDEVFYLNLTRRDELVYDTGTFKVSARTTIGYFELPSYANGNQPGPLLDVYPWNADEKPPNSTAEDSPGVTYELLEDVPNKGPLATIYLALFGNGSLPDTLSDPSYLTYLNRSSTSSANINSTATTLTEDPPFSSLAPSTPPSATYAPRICQDLVPLGTLLDENSYTAAPVHYCIATDEASRSEWRGRVPFNRTVDPPSDVRSWMDGFFVAEDRVRAALTAAAFMADEIWLTDPQVYGTLAVSVDEGVDVVAPVMPLAGVIVGSLLLGVFLGALWVLLVFAARQRRARWTGTLDAWAMLRMGAGVGVGALVAAGTGKEDDVLDALPGFMGDARPEGDVGRLGVGAEAELNWKRKYEAGLWSVGTA
ncbi:hypothetical protein DBV05_g4670 [Lasiodiplodia theobromae]|uniref:Uncharacterized protein n=1 Tax=Lasiodiplodia theobromae TaxID=45133 RepID=A0A5N5DFS0_9PEZI|nr:hypothetical protein DBV05_g4670 [Lasiodiplodia theobromae]